MDWLCNAYHMSDMGLGELSQSLAVIELHLSEGQPDSSVG